MTPDERAAIRARVEAATKGPWSVARCEDEIGGIDYDIESPHERRTSKISCAVERRHDAEFIAHARSDVPALLEALEASEARVQELQKALATYGVHEVLCAQYIPQDNLGPCCCPLGSLLSAPEDRSR